VLCGSLLGFIPPASAVTQGPNFASTLGTLQQWTNNSNALGANNNICATTGTTGRSIDLAGFGFTIPAAAVINGITVEPKFAGGASSTQVTVQLLKAGAPVGTSKSFTRSSGATNCSTSVFVTEGGSTNLWGTTWSAADVDGASFGVRLTKSSGGGTAYVDAVRITVAYSDVMTVNVVSGTALSASVAQSDIRAGQSHSLTKRPLPLSQP
jgi:hypothetical protein